MHLRDRQVRPWEIAPALSRTATAPPGLPTGGACAEYEVSDFVADRVFLTLKLRGLTETVPGRGVYVKKS